MIAQKISSSRCAEILKALSDETRILIVRRLFEGERCGTQIASELDMSQPHIAHHLGVLKNASLVEARRRGQRVLYKLHPNIQEALPLGGEMSIHLGCCKVSFF